ncbi:heparan-alpha-glucosaminide N-acetyltransferase domain-containing protein [Litorihabitans aurantiacus]|uniref:DUF418 domain-containing protein n=1 Tax=Litorihabitans aurantiacus TaxID=1930061 RepID=A0AA37UHG0_9MICO|nr:heparan-alpha-glucosaminide N-acetyltransferase domain-containing protein [Litorihabitans aurantiacus]GMA30798.1 hypothetical protein GCM10025875_07900 [Litorihabitans aurantiacus]
MSAPQFPPGTPLPATASVPGVAPAPTPGSAPGPAGSPATSALPGRVEPRRRLGGVDVARSIAVLGMLVAHLGTGHDARGGGWGEQWMWIFDGRSSALFATLAGVSLALLSRSTAREDRPGWRVLRARIAVRSLLLLGLGLVLQLLGTPVVVILTIYAVLFLLALPLLRLGNGWLLGLAALAITLGPVVVHGLRQSFTGGVQPTVIYLWEGPVVGELVLGYYPAIVWMAYVLVGIVVGRGALASRRYAAGLVGVGVVLAASAYGLGAALASGERSGPFDPLFWPDVLVSIEPHSDSGLEVTGNIGVALAVIGVCLLATSIRAGDLALAPLAALGSMSLTIYSIQLVVIAILGENAVYYPESNVPLVALAAASIAFAWAWRLTLGQGPLERLLKLTSVAATRGMTR